MTTSANTAPSTTSTGISCMDLSWVVVSNLEAAVKYYTEVIGLTIHMSAIAEGWAELSAPSGAKLGLAQEDAHMPISAGSNAVVTLTVQNLEQSTTEITSRGAEALGGIVEYAEGTVRLQMIKDIDGNLLQLMQLSGSCCAGKSSCNS